MGSIDKITVLDMTHALAGPTAGMILADMGARVIKIEHPHGDHFRPFLGGAFNAAFNRNKLGVSLDVKQPEGRRTVSKLISRSDVFMESFTPGTMDKLGLGYEAAKAINPQIIYCSISGFGQEGPYRRLPGYDVVAQAMCGIMMCTGMPDGPPVRIGASWIDMGTGMFAVIGILKALLDRRKTGRGKYIDVSLLDTALSWMSPFVAHYSMSGELPQRLGSAHVSMSPYQVFRCKDGYLFIGASNDKFWKRLCSALKIEHLAEDPRFATNDDRVRHRSQLAELIEGALSNMERDILVTELREAGMPCGPVLNVGQVLEDRHVQARGIVSEREHPEYGRVTQVRTPIAENGVFPEIRTTSPFLGEHTRQVLSEIGYSEREIEELFEKGVAVETGPGALDRR